VAPPAAAQAHRIARTIFLWFALTILAIVDIDISELPPAMSHHKDSFHADESRSRRHSHSNSGTHSFTSLKGLLQPTLNRKRLWLCSLVSFAVGFVWGIGDATIIPFLLNHGVSNAVASLVFLTNPIIGIFLHPIVGNASDKCTSSLGKRRPFIYLFAVLLIVGCALQVLADSLDGLAVVAVIFIGFFLVDSCADQFLGPGRSMMVNILPHPPSSCCRVL
jgi:sugar phosphate permease